MKATTQTVNDFTLRNLHSSMDRFEVVLDFLILLAGNDLHSSMDRFEAENGTGVKKIGGIYIPVWIDLKGHNSSTFQPDNRYLHSSMDRFEGKMSCLGSCSRG